MSIFKKSDLNGFFALFADNLANMVIMSAVCIHVIHIPSEIVFGRILPGLGVALLFGLGLYARLAWKLSKVENRDDVTALPYGISTPVMFVYLFGVMLPAYQVTGDGTSAWQITMAACFIGGVIEALGSVFGPWLKSVTPRAGMLGTLAGIAIVYIATIPLAMIFEQPLIGFPALIIIFLGLIAAIRMPFGIPAGLLAIVVGSMIGLFTGVAKFSLVNTGFFLPIPLFGDLLEGVRLLVANPTFLAVVIPIEIYNFIETMNNVESAEAAGDSYNVQHCQIIDGAGTMLGSLFGGCFPTTVYIGPPAYKRLGARIGYALLVGVVFFLGSLFGLVGFLYELIPHVAVAPLLVFVGVVITTQAFTSTPREHAPAVAVALIPHIASLLALQVSKTATTVQQIYETTLKNHQIFQDAPTQLSGLIDSSSAVLATQLPSSLLQSGIHYSGEQLLAYGAIITGLIWGAITALLIDRKFYQAGAFSFAAAVLTLFGIVHAAQLGWYFSSQIFYAYLIMTLMFLISGYLKLERDEEIAASL